MPKHCSASNHKRQNLFIDPNAKLGGLRGGARGRLLLEAARRSKRLLMCRNAVVVRTPHKRNEQVLHPQSGHYIPSLHNQAKTT